MGTAFALWLDAYKRYVESERRLGVASRTAWQMGLLPPQDLIDEVNALRAEAERLLALAEEEIKRN